MKAGKIFNLTELAYKRVKKQFADSYRKHERKVWRKNLQNKKRIKMKRPPQQVKIDRLTAWESVFLQSKVNGGEYRGEQLKTNAWSFPKSSWLQERLAILRQQKINAR